MQFMAKKKNPPMPEPVKPETVEAEQSPDVWRLFTKIDIALKEPFEAYMKSLEYPTDQARIIEKAFREFLERKGFWPPK